MTKGDSDASGREALFEEHRASLNNSALRVGAILAATLVPLFAILDRFIIPEQYTRIILYMRLVVAAYALACLGLTYTPWARRHVSFLSVSLFLAAAVSITAMIYLHEGYRSGYYAGLMLVVLTTGILFKWNGLERYGTYAAIYLMYLVPSLFSEIEQPAILISNSFFLVSTMIIVAAAQAYNVRLVRQEFLANLDLQQTKASLENAVNKLEQVDRLKNQFFSNITHELRTPLTMILSPLESLFDGEVGGLDRKQREYIAPIRRNALKLLALINDLLDLAQVEESFLRLRVQHSDLVELLEEIVSYTAPLARRKEIDVSLEIERTCDDLYVDVAKMERVIVNLVSNALKFTEPGGRVVLRLDFRDGEVVLAVRDTGPGIAPEHLELIFERFRQTDGSVTRRYGGTGIGLALAKEFVELHGGRITVTSEVGVGSEFCVHLLPGEEHFNEAVLDRRQGRAPGVRRRRSEDRGPREWTRQVQESTDYRFLHIDEATERRVVRRGDETAKATKVLVVEDNVEVLRFLSSQLSEEHSVYAAANGKKGLEIAIRERPDVVVTDYMMPEMDGLAMLRAIREHERTSDIPVVLLTAKADLENRVEARQVGADVYLGKPFSPRELRAAVQQLLHKRGRQASLLMREQIRSLEVISAGLAHEIHNPLSSIRTALYVIGEKMSALDEQLRALDLASLTGGGEVVQVRTEKVLQMQDVARRSVERIERVVNLVRGYAREGYPRQLVRVPLDKLIRELVPLIFPKHDENLHVSFDLDAAGVFVNCIVEELEQVISNLWQNALDAIGGAGQVKTKTWVEGPWVMLRVSDDGPGINQDTLPRIFTPFFTTKPPGQGMGVGLAITHQIVSQHGGEISVQSVDGEGATFTVKLPVASDVSVSAGDVRVSA